MKAVIVDLSGNDAVALRDDGRFEKIKNKNYSIGQEIIMQPQTIRFPKQAAIAASAAIVIAACGGMGTYTWSNPISYVSLDINPSIAYSLNAFNRVITVSGMNDEGAAIVDAIGDSLKNTDITTALSITVEQLSTDAYLDSENTNYMIIGVYSDKDSKADALMSTVDEFTAASVDTCSITTVNVSKETKETADSYGITGGKMELINEIANVAADPKEIDPVALADLTVAELKQTKSVAASGASITEVVASVTPDKKESKAAETTPEDPVVSKETTPTSQPEDNQTDTSSTSNTNSGTAIDSKPAASGNDTTVAASEPTTSDSKTSSSDSNAQSHVSSASVTNSTAKSEETSSEKKDDTSLSPTKEETPVPADKTETGNAAQKENPVSDKKDHTASEPKDKDKDSDNNNDKNSSSSSDKKEDASSEQKDTSSSEKKDNSSSDKKDSSSSDKKEESSSDKKEDVVEDSSQQTNSHYDPEFPEEPMIELPLSDDDLIACSIAI